MADRWNEQERDQRNRGGSSRRSSEDRYPYSRNSYSRHEEDDEDDDMNVRQFGGTEYDSHYEDYGAHPPRSASGMRGYGSQGTERQRSGYGQQRAWVSGSQGQGQEYGQRQSQGQGQGQRRGQGRGGEYYGYGRYEPVHYGEESYGRYGNRQGRQTPSGYQPEYMDDDDNLGYMESSGHYAGGEHAGKGPKGYRKSDDRLREQVCEALSDSSYLDASDIEVSVKNGEVTLSGSVTSRDDKREAEDVIEGISGVDDVQNNIKVKREGRTGNTTSGRLSEAG